MPVAIAIMPILPEISAPALGVRRALPVAGFPRGDRSTRTLRVPKDRLANDATKDTALHFGTWTPSAGWLAFRPTLRTAV
jgi:hypothetical protein